MLTFNILPKWLWVIIHWILLSKNLWQNILCNKTRLIFYWTAVIIISLLFPFKELLKCSSLSETGMGVDSDNAVPIFYSNTYYVDLGMDAVRFSIWENLPSLRIESPGWYLFQLSPATFITLPLVLSPVSFHTLCEINCQINPFPNFTIKETLNLKGCNLRWGYYLEGIVQLCDSVLGLSSVEQNHSFLLEEMSYLKEMSCHLFLYGKPEIYYWTNVLFFFFSTWRLIVSRES